MDRTPTTLWLTGLPGSGKSTLASLLSQAFELAALRHAVLDGDVVRTGLCRDLGFSESDRHENVRRVAEVARLMNQAGLHVICALISPARADRQMARQIVGADHFVEVYLSTALKDCEDRDPKGHYRRARAGTMTAFTGVGAAYEPPEAPALSIDTSRESEQVSLQKLLAFWASS